MIKFTGTPASGGYAQGKIKIINRRITGYKRVVLSAPRERSLYSAANTIAKDEIKALMENAPRQQQDILNFQLLMLDDKGMNKMISEHIENGAGAAKRCEYTMDEYCQRLKATGDEYLAERTGDIRDVLSRIIDILDGRTRARFVLTEPCIIVADEILPSDLAQIDRKFALGFVTVGGSYQAHANIIARTMGIPSVCLVDSEILNPLYDSRQILLDGYTGKITVNPDRAALEKFNTEESRAERAKISAKEIGKKHISLPDGDEVEIWANCNAPEDIEKAIENGAQGIGLVRSEILFMKDVFPDYDVQYKFYCDCIRAARGKPIIIRVFDIGADKPVAGVRSDREPNPALGVRGIRLQHRHRDLFITQLKALYKAADDRGDLNVMLPMVSMEKDVTDFLGTARLVRDEMLADGEIKRDKITWGIMIETPAAALISDELAKLVSFFSIGTNDLTQYTMAADRLNPEMSNYYKSGHPAVLKLMQMTVENAKKHGVKVSVCGESASDAECAMKYIDIGIRYLSMAQNVMLTVKEQLVNTIEDKQK